MRQGRVPIQGGPRSKPISLALGFASDAYGYAIDLGMPSPENPFPLDPVIKGEAMWTGERLSRSSLFAERRNALVRLRMSDSGVWREAMDALSPFDSMVTHCADPADGFELLSMRERMRDWRFYDALRTDPDAPARRPGIHTYTPVLASDGADLAAALATIRVIGDARTLDETIEAAFPGSRLLDDPAGLRLRQHGLLRPLGPTELSDGTLRFLLLVAALLSPRPPELMVLNEPEASLHPSLMPPLAHLLKTAARQTQIVLVSHSAALIAAFARGRRLRGGAAGKKASAKRPPPDCEACLDLAQAIGARGKLDASSCLRDIEPLPSVPCRPAEPWLAPAAKERTGLEEGRCGRRRIPTGRSAARRLNV